MSSITGTGASSHQVLHRRPAPRRTRLFPCSTPSCHPCALQQHSAANINTASYGPTASPAVTAATHASRGHPTAAAAGPPPPPSPTNPAVALDVEFAHYLTAEGKHISVPAWVAVVDEHCGILLKTFIQQQVAAASGWRWIGGVPLAACRSAPPLPAVLQQLQQLTDGQLLLGHGLSKDLHALGLDHPTELCFDTMTHPAFCNASGNCKNLKQLARQFLGQDIQQPQQTAVHQQQQQQRKRRRREKQQGAQSPQANTTQTVNEQQQQQQHGPGQGHCSQDQLQQEQGQQEQQKEDQQQQQQQQQAARSRQARPGASARPVSGHDPEEDAAAVMLLYQQVVFPSTYEGQVAAATARALAAMQQPHAENA